GREVAGVGGLHPEIERAHEGERLVDRHPLGAAVALGGAEAGPRRGELLGPQAVRAGGGEKEDPGAGARDFHTERENENRDVPHSRYEPSPPGRRPTRCGSPRSAPPARPAAPAARRRGGPPPPAAPRSP